METIRELIARLASLTPDELAELRSQIVAEFERLDAEGATVEDVAAMQELAELGEQAMAEQSNREAVAAQAESDRAAARERIQALNPPAEEPETPQTPEAESPEEPAAEEPAAEATPEPVVAAGQVQRMAARQGAPAASPEAGEARPTRRRATLTATGALRHDGTIENRDTLSQQMADLLTRMHRSSKPRGDVVVASLTYDYPEERVLGSDAWENSRKMDAVNALVATGGICLPVNVDYAVPTWATAERPIRDGLPGYQATRGGIRYVQPPDIGALSGATGIWTEATDLAPGSQTKPLVSVSCGTEELVYVEAVSTRLGFGNMFSRFAPEQVAANTDLAIAAAARVAENNLLNLIATQCVADVTVAKALSAARDIITAIHSAVAAYRNVHRLPRSQTLTAIFPDWIKELLKIDLARETAHDNASNWNVLKMTDEQVVSLLEDSTGINCIFHLDGQPTSVAGGVAQVFAAQSGTGALNVFPTTCVWYLFAEGMFQFLDAGRLDLGVVRDSTLDATNDYECHSSDTAILTRDHDWQRFADLGPEDFVATRNPRTGALEFQRPTHHTVGPRKGHMHHFTTPDGGDLLVSPRHRMLVGEGPAVAERFMSARDIRPGEQRLIGLDGLHESWEHSLVEDYDDQVYCVTVPNETLLTRRPGAQPAWAGNTFVETFENVAFRGFANGALQLVSTLCATGTSTTPLSFTTCA